MVRSLENSQPMSNSTFKTWLLCSSRSLAFPEPQGVQGHVSSTSQEGIIPGLDFCNHRESSTAKWTIFGTPGLKVMVTCTCVTSVACQALGIHGAQLCTATYRSESFELKWYKLAQNRQAWRHLIATLRA